MYDERLNGEGSSRCEIWKGWKWSIGIEQWMSVTLGYREINRDTYWISPKS
jgi:hypothetical protein